MLFALAIVFCAAWPIDGQIQNTNQKLATNDTGWSLEADRWVWGYADPLTPIVNPLTSTAQAFTNFPAKIKNIQSHQNGTEVNNPPANKKSRPFEHIFDTDIRKILKNNDTARKLVLDDLCSPLNASVPDFTAPGIRISDIKCQEFIWQIKYSNAKSRRIALCKYLKRINGLIGNMKPAVAGGRKTAPGEFPHMGAIGWKGINGEWQFKCGSSLISPKFVLTAAHCTKASEGDTSLADTVPKIVRLSYKMISIKHLAKNKGNFDISILNIISHPDYYSPKKYYDIALIELKRAVGFSQLVQPSCLWGHTDLNKLGSVATLTGWGVLAEGNLDISPELQAAVLDIIDSDNCAEYLKTWCNRNWCGVRDHQLCAGKLAGGVDACHGDSGSPLQVKISLDIDTTYNMYYIIGMTSFGVGCAQPNLPGVYTRVSSFIDWIENIVWSS